MDRGRSINRKQVAALVGVAPYAFESGRLKGRRCIWGGRAHVRQVLYMAAMSASNWSSELAANDEHFGTRSAVNAKGLPGAVNRRFLLKLISC